MLPRILVIGSGPTTLSALRSLSANGVVIGLIREVQPGDAAIAYAVREGIPLLGAVLPSALREIISRIGPDVVVISSYDRVLKPDVLATAPFLNVHYSSLPRYRGRANVNWALINGEEDVGLTIHSVTPGLDDGPILFQGSVPIQPRDTITILYERLNALLEQQLGTAVRRFLEGDPGRPQPSEVASYCCTRLPMDGDIEWGAPTDVIDRLIRALTFPFPGAFTFFEGKRLAIHRAEPVVCALYEGRIPGRVAAVSLTNGTVDVLTGDGVLRLFEVEMEGDITRPAAEVIRSLRSTLGISRADLQQRIYTLESRLAALEEALASGSENLRFVE